MMSCHGIGFSLCFYGGAGENEEKRISILFIEYLGKELPVKCFIERELDFSSFFCLNIREQLNVKSNYYRMKLTMGKMF